MGGSFPGPFRSQPEAPIRQHTVGAGGRDTSGRVAVTGP